MNERYSGSYPADEGPVTEADLHAYVDGQLGSERSGLVEAYIATHASARTQVEAWRRQNQLLRTALDDVQDEPIPLRLSLARKPARTWWHALAAGLVCTAIGALVAWQARGVWDAQQAVAVASAVEGERLAQRAAVAHQVFASDMGRPVEVKADQEQAMVRWLSRRLGEPLRVPVLASVGYTLVGGRVLPGEQGAVAQLMYGDSQGQRLTLYVTREARGGQTAFRFAQEGAVRVFYWVDGKLGYALSGEVARDELWRVCEEVYRQLDMVQLPAPPGPVAG
ncbi:anti-sigma factor [Pusillimonas sp. TS35]|uniref:anti-sigma factor family protein n=1 Tax=Paracandidimonas lactea TaxID=2895524 RepID=UPI001370B398|nr:anti-sigma factor [Paracandidimonas lactea]MYN14516.1 anti-sigma factor [Pusillimonas sp. TS35]